MGATLINYIILVIDGLSYENMSVFLRVDINIAAMILLGVVILLAYKSLDRKDSLNSKFLCTCFIIVIGTLFETITCIINRRPEQWMIAFSKLMHICLFANAPVMSYAWYNFVYIWVMPGVKINFRKHILLLFPIVINLFITVMSLTKGWVFNISELNVYQRGSLFYISSAIIYFYLFCSLLLLFKQRKKIIRQEYVPLAIFGVLPMLGGLAQTMFYGTLLMWSSCAFSLVIVYNFLQQRMVNLDTLTGAWTRGSFQYYISQRIKKKGDDRFGAIVIDLDGLKLINDEYGHLEGDQAITKAVQLVKSTLNQTSVIARLGGDEFVVVIDCTSREYLAERVNKIKSAFSQYNRTSDKRYKLEFSIGADIYNVNFSSFEQFLHHVDTLMYDNKKQNKVKRRQ